MIQNISKMFVGIIEVLRAYLGETLVYEKETHPAPDPAPSRIVLSYSDIQTPAPEGNTLIDKEDFSFMKPFLDVYEIRHSGKSYYNGNGRTEIEIRNRHYILTYNGGDVCWISQRQTSDNVVTIDGFMQSNPFVGGTDGPTDRYVYLNVSPEAQKPEIPEGNVPEFWIKDASIEWINGHYLPNGTDGYKNETHGTPFFVTPNPMQSAYLFMPSGGGVEFIVYPEIPELKAPENEGRQYSRKLLSQCREFETPGMDRLPFTILFENPSETNDPVSQFTVSLKPESSDFAGLGIDGTYEWDEQDSQYYNEHGTILAVMDPGSSTYGMISTSTGIFSSSNTINGLTVDNQRKQSMLSQIVSLGNDGEMAYVTITF